MGNIAWTNPGNAATTNAVYATAPLNNPQNTQYLKCTNLGFSIPSGDAILGIQVTWIVNEVTIRRLRVFDESVRVVKGGTVQGNDNADASVWPRADTAKTYGTATDLWGLVWTDVDINAATFGAALSARQIGGISSRTARVDSVEICVTHTLASDEM